MIVSYGGPVAGWDSLRLTDIYGRFADAGFPTYAPLYTLSSPLWRSLLKDKVRDAIDQGADGIHFDGGSSSPVAIFDWNAQPASFFDGDLEDSFIQSTLNGDVVLNALTWLAQKVNP